MQGSIMHRTTSWLRFYSVPLLKQIPMDIGSWAVVVNISLFLVEVRCVRYNYGFFKISRT